MAIKGLWQKCEQYYECFIHLKDAIQLIKQILVII